MKRLLIPLCALLMGCPQQSSDGYSFGEKEYEHTQIIVTIQKHPNLKDLQETAPDAAKQEGRSLQAFSILHGNRCLVHIVDPDISYEPEWLGHEITHCIYGRWHK